MSHISKWKGRDFSVLDPKNWAFRSELAAGLGKTTPLLKRSDQEMEAEGQANITVNFTFFNSILFCHYHYYMNISTTTNNENRKSLLKCFVGESSFNLTGHNLRSL